MKKIVFINSHPIQYFGPMYKYMNEQGINIEAWYCSDETVKGSLDKEFGVNVKWDIPVLDGYKYKFFKNYSWSPSHTKGFLGLINWGMIYKMLVSPKSIFVIHGWHYFTLLTILLLGKAKGHTICLRNETPQNHEKLKVSFKQKIKFLLFKYILFPRIDYFLYIGTQNHLFYKSYGLLDKQLIFCPYAVDNTRFQQASKELEPHATEIKDALGISASDKVILYSGKYIPKKRPLDLLNSFIKLNSEDTWLVMVGEGELREDMEKLIKKNNLTKVILTGFINQSKIAEYYCISDVFVMCSTIGETWGLSVNEAMNFDLPVIISDLTGCAEDLVKIASNGYIFSTANIDELTLRLQQVLIEKRLSWKISSNEIISHYSYKTITDNIGAIV
jgi:glycosyltransferase involved in cell wall biosynthesis